MCLCKLLQVVLDLCNEHKYIYIIVKDHYSEIHHNISYQQQKEGLREGEEGKKAKKKKPSNS